ncbi:MAG: hypothetical protein M1822_000222 [Bathelium mastoideum]|nr:MAG: hypothetical protein M1822_000222 [Bathelium mastoideum]
MSPTSPPRRFVPEPVETTTKSSRKVDQETPGNNNKRPRKFAPEPLETFISSSKDHAAEHGELKKPPRRFAPEPVETTSSSRKGSNAASSGHAKKKFSPQLVETSTGSNRKDGASRSDEDKGGDGSKKSQGGKPRRFSPQLMETSKRSRKSGDEFPAVPQSDRTDVVAASVDSDPPRSRTRPSPAPPQNTLAVDAPSLQAREKGHRSPIRSSSHSSTRQHSFRVPELDPIESSCSEDDSNPPSLSTSPSTGSDHVLSSNPSNENYRDATRMRESVDERFSGYLLQLAARAAEKQLREQAMAAFPNSDFHEPVDHYVDKEDDDSDQGLDDRVATWEAQDEYIDRRETAGKVNWELLEMQRHQEQRELQRAKERESENRSASRQSRTPWWDPVATIKAFNDFQQKDSELKQMRNAASPPMLGGDIRFPRCPSPEPARFDVTQGSLAARKDMCYLTEQSRTSQDEHGLWGAPKQKARGTGTSGRSKDSSRSGGGGGGLWGGFCHADADDDDDEKKPDKPSARLGLMTPKSDPDMPFDRLSMTPAHRPSPSSSHLATSREAVASIDARLAAEQSMDEEYPDSFVTQVYNYLSLGYPSLARPYDHELARISKIDVAELRQDDKLASSRGYILLGEDGEVTGKGHGVSESHCARWRALRRYIREWARQQPRMDKESPLGQWGVGPRRGSWAI